MANLLGTTVNGSLLIGPSGTSHAYDGAATGKLYFGNQVSDSPTHYHITTNMENYNGNYSKLDIRWYTGQRFYAHTGYGGFRFHEITTAAELFSVGKGDAHVRVENNLYVGNTIYNNGNAVIHAGNIGSQSVNYASESGITEFQKIPDHRGNAYIPNDYAGNRVWWHFNNKDAVGGYGTYWHAIQTVSPWSSYDSSHRQQQIQWGGTDISFRYATSGTTWSSWFRFITDANIASQSVSYAVTSGTSSATTQTNFSELSIGGLGVATREYVTSQGYLTSLPSHNHDDRYYTESESDGRYVPYGSIAGSFGLNDNKLYLRTNGDNNHYLWNAADDWEEMVYYSGTGFRVKGSTGTVPAYFSESGVYASAYRGKDNVGGTGTASWHPDGIYVGSTQWLYGTQYRNGSTTSGQGWMYLDYNYGHSIVGLYSSYRYQGVFAMGDSYKLPADGTGVGNLYGMTWSHPNAGGVAGNLNTHGLLVLENGTFLAAISGSIRSRDDMRAPIFYDSADTTYYLDPNAGTSLKIAGGIVSTAANGAVLLKHEVSEANAWIFRENAANWGLFWFNAGNQAGQTIGSYTTVGAELFGMNNAVTGYNPNSAWSGTNADTRASWMLSNYSGYLWTQGTQYSETDMRAPIFYDSQNTAYYLDPNSTSYLYHLVLSGNSYFRPNTWIQFDGNYGVYWPTIMGYIFIQTMTALTAHSK